MKLISTGTKLSLKPIIISVAAVCALAAIILAAVMLIPFGGDKNAEPEISEADIMAAREAAELRRPESARLCSRSTTCATMNIWRETALPPALWSGRTASPPAR